MTTECDSGRGVRERCPLLSKLRFVSLELRGSAGSPELSVLLRWLPCRVVNGNIIVVLVSVNDKTKPTPINQATFFPADTTK